MCVKFLKSPKTIPIIENFSTQVFRNLRDQQIVATPTEKSPEALRTLVRPYHKKFSLKTLSLKLDPYFTQQMGSEPSHKYSTISWNGLEATLISYDKFSFFASNERIYFVDYS